MDQRKDNDAECQSELTFIYPIVKFHKISSICPSSVKFWMGIKTGTQVCKADLHISMPLNYAACLLDGVEVEIDGKSMGPLDNKEAMRLTFE